MEKRQHECALLRPGITHAEMPSERENADSVQRQIVEIARLRIERDRLSKHARCALLRNK